MDARDKDLAEVAAMQFAGGMGIARVAESWDRDADWVESAIRQALLATIPVRDGGTKPPRVEERITRRGDAGGDGAAQGALFEENAA